MNATECSARLGSLLDEFARIKDIDRARWRGAELSEDELAGFARAASSGIVVIANDATVTFPGLRLAKPPKRYQLFLIYEGGAANPGPAMSWSWQEMFCQIVFATELVLDHGWDAGGVALEVGPLDVGAGEPDSVLIRPRLLAEAKLHDGGSHGLAAMMSVFAELNGTGPAAQVGERIRTNAERKYRYMQRFEPQVFVEVAPGVRRAHSVESRSGALFFEPLARIPLRSEVSAAGGATT